MNQLIDKLPQEILALTLTFVDIQFDKNIIYIIDYFSKKKRKIVKTIEYYPSELFFVDKFWFNSILYTKCKICRNGNYNLIRKKCISCGHVMESNQRRSERKRRLY